MEMLGTELDTSSTKLAEDMLLDVLFKVPPKKESEDHVCT